MAPRIVPPPVFRIAVNIDGGFGSLHRLSDRTIDETDITARAPVLADYIETVLATHGLTRARIAIGFSNVRSWRESWS